MNKKAIPIVIRDPDCYFGDVYFELNGPHTRFEDQLAIHVSPDDPRSDDELRALAAGSPSSQEQT